MHHVCRGAHRKVSNGALASRRSSAVVAFSPSSRQCAVLPATGERIEAVERGVDGRQPRRREAKGGDGHAPRSVISFTSVAVAAARSG